MNPLLIGPIFDLFKTVLGGLGIDPAAKERAQQQAFELLTKGDFAQNAELQLALAQIAVNKAEAESPGIFKGGWRPFLGWVGAVGLAYQWLVVPFAAFAYTTATGHALPVAPPIMDPNILLLLGSLLGVNITARSVEKVRGAA